MDKIKDYFKRYPNATEVFVNGGKLFHARGAADSFGKDETKRYTRKDAESKAESLGGQVNPKTKESVIEALKATDDLSAAPFDSLKIWIKILELKPADNKKESILKALTDFKETLKAE